MNAMDSTKVEIEAETEICASCGSSCFYITSLCNWFHCMHCGDAATVEHEECSVDPGMRERGLTLSQAKKILRWKNGRNEALAILKDAADSIEDYKETFYDECDMAHEWEETVAEASDIKHARFDYVYEIYGRGII